MKINYEAHTIELTKAESKAASTFGSNMYKALREAKQDNPSFTVVVSKRTRKGEYKGLDYGYMERYIAAHDDAEETNMNAFNTLRGKGSKDLQGVVETASYGEIREWFLSTYPEIAEYNQKVSDILNSAKSKKEAA